MNEDLKKKAISTFKETVRVLNTLEQTPEIINLKEKIEKEIINLSS